MGQKINQFIASQFFPVSEGESSPGGGNFPHFNKKLRKTGAFSQLVYIKRLFLVGKHDRKPLVGSPITWETTQHFSPKQVVGGRSVFGDLA